MGWDTEGIVSTLPNIVTIQIGDECQQFGPVVKTPIKYKTSPSSILIVYFLICASSSLSHYKNIIYVYN